MERYLLMNKDAKAASAILEAGPEGERLRMERVFGALPIGLKAGTLTRWAENRMASRHSRHLRELMRACRCDTLGGFLRATHAASTIDTFWIKGEEEPVSWQQVSPYRNAFNRSVSRIAFGVPGTLDLDASTVSPELTTDGSFQKCFQRETGMIYLYKRGTTGAANAGLGPYGEFLASEIAGKVCGEAVPYDLVRLYGVVSSRCALFTSEQNGYVPMSAMTRSTTPGHLLQFFAGLSEEAEERFREMLVLDAILFNTDRHLGNFGVLVNNDTARPLRMAPVFDFNLSLFPYAMEEELQDPGDLLIKYVPVLGSDFTRTAQQAMTQRIRDRVKGLEGFRFSFQGDEKFSQSRIRLLEEIIGRQVDALLSQDGLQTRDVFVPARQIQKERKAQEAAKRLDRAYALLSCRKGFFVSVIQDTDTQAICLESSEDADENPSVYLDFLRNTAEAFQDGMRISEQTLPLDYRDAIQAAGPYLGRAPGTPQ